MLSLATISMSLLALTPSHAVRVLKEHGVPATEGSNAIEDALGLATNDQDWYEGLCEKHTPLTVAQEAVDIVDRLWKSNGENCEYAARQFRSHAEEALRLEFPYNCRTSLALRVTRLGRGMGENKINSIIRKCSPYNPTRKKTATGPPADRADDIEFGKCGKYFASAHSAQEAVNIVDRLWKSHEESCRDARDTFKSHAKSALLDEFPDNCMDNRAFDANLNGRKAGRKYMKRVIKRCPKAPPRPPSNSSPTEGSNEYVDDDDDEEPSEDVEARQ